MLCLGCQFSCLSLTQITRWYQTHRHHPPRRLANEKHPLRIRLVLVHRVLDHVGDGVAVGAPVPLQRRARRHVPAPALVGRLRVHDDKLLLVRQSLVRAAVVVLLRRARAVVHPDEHRRLLGESGGLVDKHARRALDGGAVVGDLLELGGRAGCSEEGGGERGELHVDRGGERVSSAAWTSWCSWDRGRSRCCHVISLASPRRVGTGLDNIFAYSCKNCPPFGGGGRGYWRG